MKCEITDLQEFESMQMFIHFIKLFIHPSSTLHLSHLRKSKLEESQTFFQLMQDFEDQDAWLTEATMLAKSHDVGKDLASCTMLIKRHEVCCESLDWLLTY